jgi:hypothetical protein
MYSILSAVIILVFTIVYLVRTMPITVVNTIPVHIETVPEFRGPPLKRYKPRHFQQMGLLTNDDGSTLPLYGRESITHRDRYHYYTTTPGEQIYSLPITYNDRDCSEDIGCPEFYGNESVTVTGQSGNFSTNIYRTENFPQIY